MIGDLYSVVFNSFVVVISDYSILFLSSSLLWKRSLFTFPPREICDFVENPHPGEYKSLCVHLAGMKLHVVIGSWGSVHVLE